MARKRNVLPFPKQQQSAKPLAVRKLSDHERLLLEKGLAALDAVIAQANVAGNEMVVAVMKLSEVDPEEGWMFNRQKMRWEKHPVAVDA